MINNLPPKAVKCYTSGGTLNMTYYPVSFLNADVNPTLAKPPLKFDVGLAKFGLTPL